MARLNHPRPLGLSKEAENFAVFLHKVVKDEVEAGTQEKNLELAGEGGGAGGNLTLRFLNWYSRLMSFTWVKSRVSYYSMQLPGP